MTSGLVRQLPSRTRQLVTRLLRCVSQSYPGHLLQHAGAANCALLPANVHYRLMVPSIPSVPGVSQRPTAYQVPPSLPKRRAQQAKLPTSPSRRIVPTPGPATKVTPITDPWHSNTALYHANSVAFPPAPLLILPLCTHSKHQQRQGPVFLAGVSELA